MARKRKTTDKTWTLPKGIGIGVMTSIVVMIAGAAILGYLIIENKIAESAVRICSIILLVLSSVAGSLVALNLVKRLRVQVCAILGLCYYLGLMACTALFFGGQYNGIITTGVTIFASCAVAALLCTFNNKSGKMKRRKIPYR